MDLIAFAMVFGLPAASVRQRAARLRHVFGLEYRATILVRVRFLFELL